MRYNPSWDFATAPQDTGISSKLSPMALYVEIVGLPAMGPFLATTYLGRDGRGSRGSMVNGVSRGSRSSGGGRDCGVVGVCVTMRQFKRSECFVCLVCVRAHSFTPRLDAQR